MNIESKYILSYYDIPELFVSTDDENLFYISLFVDAINDKARYLTRQIFIDELLNLLEKKVTILDIFNKNNSGFWYYLDTLNDSDFKMSRILFSYDIPKRYFPSKDYIGDLYSDEIIKEIYSSFEIKKINVESQEKCYTNWKGLPKINKISSRRASFPFVSSRNLKRKLSQPITVFSNTVVKIIDSNSLLDIDLFKNFTDYSYALQKQKKSNVFYIK